MGSKPESFLCEPQKRFGTPRVSIVVTANVGAAPKGLPPPKSRRGATEFPFSTKGSAIRPPDRFIDSHKRRESRRLPLNKAEA